MYFIGKQITNKLCLNEGNVYESSERLLYTGLIQDVIMNIYIL